MYKTLLQIQSQINSFLFFGKILPKQTIYCNFKVRDCLLISIYLLFVMAMSIKSSIIFRTIGKIHEHNKQICENYSSL